ncbi:DUF4175 family protein [Olivibacter sp. XZL3]|uniref:DUF4175 family protein n=1 Tax=Olivibacter sp. XZL3 TaxID=1735116 RepID=UPI00106553FC|nr:DUF4175 family protein [Olivibacter sp. XZL3]
MEYTLGKQWLEHYRGRRRIYLLLAQALYALGAALLLASVIGFVYPLPWWTVSLMFLLALGRCLFFSRLWKATLLEVAFYLDAKFPELEYSASLFLKPGSSLGLLQRLQLQRLEERIPALSQRPEDDYKMLKVPLLIALVAIGLYALGSSFQQKTQQVAAERELAVPKRRAMPAPAAFTDASLQIRFPLYTGLPEQRQHDFGVSALKGSVVTLRLRANKRMKTVKLLFNAKKEVLLHQKDSLHWETSFKMEASGFYQIQYEGKASALYPIDVIPDRPVSIQVTQPNAHTTIEPGYPAKVGLEALLTDDYGIKDAALVATTSSGKGESVRFSSREIALKGAGGKQLRAKQTIGLQALGMKPGDELYFYIRAKDLADQESRSDMYVVTWQDTTELMSLSGMVSASDVQPEYFRSQRQIIIDIEKLLAEAPKLSKVVAQQRSNNIGIDQKLLRLRYGQFLGEEAEEGGGGEHEHEHDHGAEGEGHEEAHGQQAVPEDIETLKDQFTHHHDRAEDATFFTPGQKTQLKATLTEMWNAELKLRTYEPQEALPYAYKALRLLKDLQQQSRTYVAKAPSKPTALKPEKRLTGDLVDIVEPMVNKGLPPKDESTLVQQRLRKALAYLSNRREAGVLDREGLALLHAVQGELIDGASRAPGKYLSALKVLREIDEKEGVYALGDIRVLATAIQELLPLMPYQPAMKKVTQRENIYNSYLNLISNP